MATVSLPMVVAAKPSELTYLKMHHEKLLLYGKSFGSIVVEPTKPPTSPLLAREKALAYVSEARAAVGAKRLTKLPRGRVGQGNECVLARALPCCTTVSGGSVLFKNAEVAEKVAQAWATGALGQQVALPEALRDFVTHFDGRQYEDLIA